MSLKSKTSGVPGFISYMPHKSQIEELTNEEAGILYKRLFSYVDTGELPDFRGNKLLKIIFYDYQRELERDIERYQSMCERNRINGQKGGRPKKDTVVSEGADINFIGKNPDGFFKNPKNPI